ncbi:MAG: hypothetical protein MZV63_02760 [Marinilabiliales bacterium]|nr:hypothetical protein [Marinilabiliales bacterium]
MFREAPELVKDIAGGEVALEPLSCPSCRNGIPCGTPDCTERQTVARSRSGMNAVSTNLLSSIRKRYFFVPSADCSL